MLWALFLHAGVNGQPAEPILKLNSEFHVRGVTAIAADAGGQYLLTASDDKTARLWNAHTGNALRVFRPPVGYGKEGCLYACALSPDGSIAAVGGYTGASWNKADSAIVTMGNWRGYAKQLKYSIYLFSTTTGELVANIDGSEAAIRDLKFSPDGVYLAAALDEAKGIRIYKVGDGSEVRKLIGFGGAVRKISFSRSGRLAVVADDKYLRLYSKTFGLVTAQSLGGKPSGVAFSPDESTVAVSYDGWAKISLFRASDGADAGTLQTPAPGNAATVAYTATGLVCSGGYPKDNKYLIAVWNGSRRTDILAASGVITDVCTLPDGSVAYGTGAPEMGRITSDLATPWDWEENRDGAYLRTAEIISAPLRQRELFQLNEDGSQIGLNGVGRDVLIFSLTDRSFRRTSNIFPRFVDKAQNLSVIGWKDGYKVTLNGKSQIIMEQDEISRCVDIAKNGTRILLGTSRHLICFNPSGDIVWKRPLTEECAAVKIAGNGRVAATALGDGTYAWFEMEEGNRILTLFVHPDHRRWVLWTPAGFYDCEVGAEEIIGWNLNNGRNKASAFYHVAQFRSTFYKPEAIDEIVGVERYVAQNTVIRDSPQTADQLDQPSLDQVLPPEIRIITPQPETSVKSNQLKIRYRVSTSGKDSVESVKVLLDGRPVQLLTSVRVGDNEVTVDIPERNCEISVIAKNKYASSIPAKVKLKWSGVSEENIFKPKLYILAVGISRYNEKSLALRFAAKDADDFTRIMSKQKGFLYGDVSVKLLTDGNGSKKNILEGLEWIQRETTSKDVAMIFFAGHGVTDNTGTFFYMPAEADMNRLRSTCINYVEIKQTTAAIAGKVILFMDACHSGNVMGATRRASIDLKGVVNELASAENGVIVFTSSTGKQYSLENQSWNNGAFTKALVEGIDGKADLFRRRNISVKTLDAYITQRVKTLTNGQQSPTTIVPSSIPDFPIAIVL
ncbi:MAG: caspase family protein [Bacteroidales bacterium]|nr:caspase family protein [Bacteroidales bacterium]